ncbi:C39 family peptidase [Actinomadura scrupuli]|uniref:C39 family peptidase n=1 Tax=Actinomadura scrupuli TaxID=559629 RepID=UPI003D98710F
MTRRYVMGSLAAGVLAAVTAGVGVTVSTAGGPAATPTIARNTGQTRQAEVTAAPKPAAAPSPPVSVALKIRPEYQQNDIFCVPASSVMSLRTFGISTSQRTLAMKMHTKRPLGTYGDDAINVLNDYLAPVNFTVTNVTDVRDPAVLMRRVVNNVGIHGRAPEIAVWTERLPWNKGIPGHIGHVVLAYGYNSRARTITLWDPWRSTGGRHTISAKALARAVQHWGMYYYSRSGDVSLTTVK